MVNKNEPLIMKRICDDDVETLLGVGDKYIFVYFSASWCGPCKQLLPLVEELDKRNTDSSLLFYYADIDNNDVLCNSCNVKEVPTYAVIKDMKILGQSHGSSISTVGDLLKTCVVGVEL